MSNIVQSIETHNPQIVQAVTYFVYNSNLLKQLLHLIKADHGCKKELLHIISNLLAVASEI